MPRIIPNFFWTLYVVVVWGCSGIGGYIVARFLFVYNYLWDRGYINALTGVLIESIIGGLVVSRPIACIASLSVLVGFIIESCTLTILGFRSFTGRIVNYAVYAYSCLFTLRSLALHIWERNIELMYRFRMAIIAIVLVVLAGLMVPGLQLSFGGGGLTYHILGILSLVRM